MLSLLMRVCNVLEARVGSLVSITLIFLLTKNSRMSILGLPVMTRSINVRDLDVWIDCAIPVFVLLFTESGQP